MNSFLRRFLNIFRVPLTTDPVYAPASAILANDGLDKISCYRKTNSKWNQFPTASYRATRDIQWLDNVLLVIITLISIFVSVLLVWVFIRYNRRANPTPSSTTHNTPIEILWTIIPVFILIGIGVFHYLFCSNSLEFQIVTSL